MQNEAGGGEEATHTTTATDSNLREEVLNERKRGILGKQWPIVTSPRLVKLSWSSGVWCSSLIRHEDDAKAICVLLINTS